MRLRRSLAQCRRPARYWPRYRRPIASSRRALRRHGSRLATARRRRTGPRSQAPAQRRSPPAVPADSASRRRSGHWLGRPDQSPACPSCQRVCQSRPMGVTGTAVAVGTGVAVRRDKSHLLKRCAHRAAGSLRRAVHGGGRRCRHRRRDRVIIGETGCSGLGICTGSAENANLSAALIWLRPPALSSI